MITKKSSLRPPVNVPLRFEDSSVGAENHPVDTNHSVPSMFFALGPGYRGGFVNDRLTDNTSSPSYVQPSAIYIDSGFHGGEDVGIWADGPFSELFSGVLENTEIAYLIKYLLCIGNSGHNICDSEEQNTSLFNQLTSKL
ncbi:hypothetical protein OSTOST_02426 [Ostertagia ostertagi]